MIAYRDRDILDLLTQAATPSILSYPLLEECYD